MPFGVDLSSFIPDFAGLGTNLLTGVLILVIVVGLGLFGYFIYDYRKYKYRIEIFEKLGGTRYVLSGKDRAKLIKLGDAGEQLLLLKKRKCYRTAYGQKMGKNLIYFAIGQDGYWYNFTLGDLDAKQGELDIEPIDRDMRMMHVAIRKNIQDRYKKLKFMDKYGSLIMNGIFLIIMLFGLWFLVTKIGDAGKAMTAAAQANKETMQLAKEVLGVIDRVGCGVGSGIAAAFALILRR